MKKLMRLTILSVLVAIVSSYGTNVSAAEWNTIFNGKDIKGWEKKGGEADYRVEDGCIVGTTKPKTPNTFLCPPKKYGNFELIFEVKCDPALNSGVQIRSISNANEIPADLSEADAVKAKKKADGKSRQTAMQLEFGLKVSAAGYWLPKRKSRTRHTKKRAGTSIGFLPRMNTSAYGSTEQKFPMVKTPEHALRKDG